MKERMSGSGVMRTYRIYDMGIFDFIKKKSVISYQYSNGKKEVVFDFTMKTGKVKIVCKSALMQEPVILIPSYDPRVGRVVELGYGEQDFADDIQSLINIIDAKDMGDMAFYNAFDVFTSNHIKEFGRLIDTDLFRIIAEVISMMEALSKKNNIVFSEIDRIGITKTFVNRALSRYANLFYITKYQRTELGIEPYLEKYLK